MAALERSGLKFQAQFIGALPRSMKFCMRWSAGNLGIFLPVLVACRIAEIVGMELRHHVHRRRGHVFSNPFHDQCEAAERAQREAAEKAEREAARKVEREAAKEAKREAARVAKMEASAQAKREAAEKVEVEREAAERAEREAAEQGIREVGELAKSEVTAKPESGISDGPSFTDGIRRK